MKKLIFKFGILAFVFTFLFSSCSSDDNDGETLLSQLVGSWVEEEEEDALTKVTVISSRYLIVNPDGSFSLVRYSSSKELIIPSDSPSCFLDASGTLVVSGNTVSIEGIEESFDASVVLDGDTLSITFNDDGKMFTETFLRISDEEVPSACDNPTTVISI